MPIYLPSGGSITAAAIESALGYEPATAAHGALADTALQSLTQAAIIAALSTDPVFEGMAQFTSLGTPGDYTLAKSGIVVKNAAGVEVFRIWGTDPDLDANFNADNLYIGRQAGLTQPTDNVDAGYCNNGFGALALSSILTGTDNNAFGWKALKNVRHGVFNTAVGDQAGMGIVDGSHSLFLGGAADSTIDGDNMIGIGYGAIVTASNRAVIGDASVTDAYFGSESAAANTHQKRVFIVGTTAPADGDLAANQCALWFDPTDGAAALMVKAKQANGTVKTGTLAVTT